MKLYIVISAALAASHAVVLGVSSLLGRCRIAIATVTAQNAATASGPGQAAYERSA